MTLGQNKRGYPSALVTAKKMMAAARRLMILAIETVVYVFIVCKRPFV